MKKDAASRLDFSPYQGFARAEKVMYPRGYITPGGLKWEGRGHHRVSPRKLVRKGRCLHTGAGDSHLCLR